MNDNRKIIKIIERLGEKYCKEYLDIWDKDKLKKNWWCALDFFFNHSFMRGRRDELSNEYHQFTISALENYFSIKSLALDISFKKLKKHKKFFDKEVILDFKRRKDILSNNSVRDADFEKEVAVKNPIINALLNKKKIEIKWDNGCYNKKIRLGNDKDIMMVLDVLNFITSDNRHMNFYFYLKDIIVKSGMKKAYEELTNIYAIGDKIAAFTIRDIGMMNPDIIKNDYQFAFPVDTWVLRISCKLGYRIDSIEKVKIFFIEKCKEYNVSPLKCNAGLWYLGFHSLDILLKDCLIKIEV